MTQDRLVTSWNWRPMVGSAVATMVWSSAARNIVTIRLIRMVRVSAWVSGARGASDGASSTASTSVGKFRELGLDLFGQSLGVGRKTALPFVLVHEEMIVPGRATAAEIR